MSDQAERKVPPLRFASVGMTELFRCDGGRVGGIASHPSAKNALGWGTHQFGLGKESIGGVASLRFDFWCARLPRLVGRPLRGESPGFMGIVAARLRPGPFKSVESVTR